MRAMRLLFPTVLLFQATASTAAPLLFAQGYWLAVERPDGRSCAAMGRSELAAPKGGDQARMSFTFDRRGPRHGELYVRLSRPARPGSSILLMVGGQPFQLVGRGSDAWSRGPQQEAAIIAAVRASDDLRVRFRGASSRYTDRYLLAGAPTAIDAAAAACSRPR
jgi:hypothetical protein